MFYDITEPKVAPFPANSMHLSTRRFASLTNSIALEMSNSYHLRYEMKLYTEFSLTTSLGLANSPIYKLANFNFRNLPISEISLTCFKNPIISRIY